MAGAEGETKDRRSSYRPQSKDLLTLFLGAGFSKGSLPSKGEPDRQGTPKMGKISQGNVPRKVAPLGGIILKSLGEWGQFASWVSQRLEASNYLPQHTTNNTNGRDNVKQNYIGF